MGVLVEVKGWACCLAPSSCTLTHGKAHVLWGRPRKRLRIELRPPGPGAGMRLVRESRRLGVRRTGAGEGSVTGSDARSQAGSESQPAGALGP